MIGLWGPQSLMSKNSPLDADFANIFFKPIAQYLDNPETSEIMVNAHDDIWVEDELGLRKVPETFTSDALVSAVNSLAQFVGRPLIENVYSIDARMPDGSRVCIVLPPVSGDDPIFSIRKFKAIVSDLDFLVKKGSLTPEMVELIDACVKIKKNMMVAGGTSSGKTTLLNLIAAKIPDHDRIITIEDSRELQLKQEHVLALEAKPADKYGKGEFTIRQCLKSSLRLRPDRIVVGEIRGGEAFDLIQAMNTGHGGCMGTVHANTPTDTLRRLESLSLTADIDMPIVALRAMIASALDLVISPARLSDGSRRIVQIAEIGPLTEKGDYQTFDIARYVSTHRDKNTGKIEGYFEFTGHVPGFFEMFEAEGVDLPKEFFRKRVSGSVPEREIPKLLERGYEIPGRSKPEPSYTAIKAPLPEPVVLQKAPVIMQQSAPKKLDKIDALTDLQYTKPIASQEIPPITQQTIPPKPTVTAQSPIPNLAQTASAVQSSQFIAEPEPDLVSASNSFEDESILPEPDLVSTSNSFEDESILPEPDLVSTSNSFEDENISPEPDLVSASNRFEDESILPEPDLVSPSNSFEDESITPEPDLVSASNRFEDENISPEPDLVSASNRFEDENISPEPDLVSASNSFEDESILPEPDLVSASNSFENPNTIKEEFIPQQKIADQPVVSKRPTLLERLSKISENSNIPVITNPPSEADLSASREETYTELTNNFDYNHQPSEEPKETLEPEELQATEPIASDEYQTSSDFSFEDEIPEAEKVPKEEIPTTNYAPQASFDAEPEEITEEEKPTENKQHVVIAEILRRMRENRSSSS